MNRFSTTTLENDSISTEYERETTQNRSFNSLETSIPNDVPIMTMNNPPKNKYRVVATIMFNFCFGFSDAAPGALLPYIESSYGINYAQASFVWIGNAIGFILVASLSHKLQSWLGKRNVYPFGNLLSCIMYAIVSSGTKFPIIVIGFLFGGMGQAICAASCNIFLSRLDKQSKFLALYHGGYGIGATISPLIATSMVTRGIDWNLFYLIALGMMFLTGLALYFSFEDADMDLKPWYDDPETIEMENLNTTTPPQSSQKSIMILALQNHVTWLISLFCLFYQGAEVAVSGWITTFLLDYRKADKRLSGYFSSFFWVGLTLGRLLLTTPIHRYIGCRRGVLIISIISIILIGLTWAVKVIPAEAVFVAFAGLSVGPNYPLLVTFVTQPNLLPRKIQIVSLTILTAFGSSGGALLPFIVGLLSQKIGTFVVLPVFVITYSAMTMIWMFLPNIEKQNQLNKVKLSFWDRVW